jgi:chemotaxis protein histidine kinase CheA
VVVQSGANVRCLLVDALLHKSGSRHQKPQRDDGPQKTAFAGATILGDGRVGLILDVNALAHQEKLPLSKAA